MGPLVFVVRFFDAIFFAGLLGSAVVIFISFVHDGKELLVKE